jgi:NAD(P)-dependent dehydrogenase (short-subunit alcohol dehydrogenase family)
MPALGPEQREDDMTDTRTWLITGCSSGLGQAMAQALIDRGDNVVATARDTAKLAGLVDGRSNALALTLDVTRQDQIEKAVADACTHFGRIDILVNNAGFGHLGAIEDVPMADVRAVLEADLIGPIMMIKAVLPGMRARGSGRIVNIASVGGLAGFGGSGFYCAAKFGLAGLSESLAAEVGPLGIKVMLVAPGPFNTAFSNTSLRITPPSIPDYDLAAFFERAGISDWATQGDDPVNGAAAIIAAVDRDDPPPLLFVGKAGRELIISRLEKQIGLLSGQGS